MKIVFFGDSITDARRDRSTMYAKLGVGYVNHVAHTLEGTNPDKYSVTNLGIGGDRIVDLYARLHQVWKAEPDVLSILVGVNDVWHNLKDCGPGIDIDRYENVYRLILKDAKKHFPNVKLMVLEPFYLEGYATKDHEELFKQIYDYAKVAKKVAAEEGALFLPLQEKLSALAEKFGNESVLIDGVHPNIAGSKLIADEWIKLFKENIDC